MNNTQKKENDTKNVEKNTITYNKFNLAPLHKRFIAFIIDIGIGYISILGLLKIGLGIPFDIIFMSWGWGRIFIAWIFLIYFTIMIFFSKGQTLGYKLLNIKVVKINGLRISFLQSLLRSFFLSMIAFPLILERLSIYLTATFLIFSFLLLITGDTGKNKQTLWDAKGLIVIENKC